jgi:hypothetical protein
MISAIYYSQNISFSSSTSIRIDHLNNIRPNEKRVDNRHKAESFVCWTVWIGQDCLHSQGMPLGVEW